MPVPSQFRTAVPGQPFLHGSTPQLPPGGQNMPPGPNQPMRPNQHMQQLPLITGMPGGPMPSQPMGMPYGQSNRPTAMGAQQNQHSAPPFGNHTSGVGGMGVPFSAYTFEQASHLPTPQAPNAGQPWLSSVLNPPDSNQQSSSDWQEHATPDGRRYYNNEKTKQSIWEKPVELMTPMERADASTVWKEFTTPEGKKYYYNKVTKESKWTIPEELKLAREQAEKAASHGVQIDTGMNARSAVVGILTSGELPASAAVFPSSNVSSPIYGVISTPLSIPPVVNQSPGINGASSEPPVMHSAAPTSKDVPNSPAVTSTRSASTPGDAGLPATSSVSSVVMNASDRLPSQVISTSVPDVAESHKDIVAAGKVDLLSEEKTDDEPLVFANKQEAKSVFKLLLEYANVQSDWTWDQAMRVVVNDKRYGALKTIGERKQAFHEYLGQRKKQEAEEGRMRLKKAQEEFSKMLEESDVLTSSMKWSEVITLFEDDERFIAVEKPKDRQELFENYLVELQKKKKEKAEEEYRRNREDYWKFLESCDFIEANSLWRKVQDRLEDDDSCSHLEKIDRLEIFQDYIRYLEKEEEHKKHQKEQLRRTERKNRDEFRNMLEADIAAGVLTAKTSWREYCGKVKESSAYLAVAHNTSGSTPKDLFEDVVDDLENQYHDDKSRIKDAMKLCKITLTSLWTFEELKKPILQELGSSPILDINLKLVFEEQLDRIKEKEEKEAKKRQRLIVDLTDLLQSFKEITASSTWEDSKQLIEDSEEYREIGDETLAREMFEDYVVYLQEKAKERERKHEEKAKKEKEREEKERWKEERKEKYRDRDREKRKERSKKEESDDEAMDATDSHSHKDESRKEKGKDRDRKHRKRHHDVADDVRSDKDDDKERRHRKRH